MKFENTEVFNFEGAIRGMRNPLESWDKSDSHKCMMLCEDGCPFYNDKSERCQIDGFNIGKNTWSPSGQKSVLVVCASDESIIQT